MVVLIWLGECLKSIARISGFCASQHEDQPRRSTMRELQVVGSLMRVDSLEKGKRGDWICHFDARFA